LKEDEAAMTKFLDQITISIGGQNVSEEFYTALEEILVDTSLNMPGMFTIRVHDPKLKWVDDALLDIGKEVEIKVETNDGTIKGPQQLIKGEITALEPCFSAEGATSMVVRGYDKSHRLHRGRKTRTFVSKTDSDLVTTLAGEAGLSSSVDSTSLIYPHILQYNQTNMEFLMARAERIGYQVYVENGTLNFKKGNTVPAATATLTYLENLIQFEPRYTASHQFDTMQVKGWDAKTKKAITAQATPEAGLNQGGLGQTGGAKAQSAFSSASEIAVDLPVATADEATAIAKGLSQDISREFVQADGQCYGHPLVKAGACIKIERVGTRFSGNYLVTTAAHVYNEEGYRTYFTITGRHAPTLSHLLAGNEGSGQENGMVNGLVTAVVTNINDQDNMGRIKVKFGWLGEIESDWVRMAAPMAGAQRGLLILPEVNDEVVVAFEHGDVNHPYVLGVLWSQTDKPPLTTSEAVANGKVAKRTFKTTAGHQVTFVDGTSGGPQIMVRSKSGHEVILDDTSGSEKISIKDKTGQNSMEINSTTNSMAIKVNGDFTVDAKGKVEIKSMQALNLTGTAGMNLESKANASVKGLQLSLEGQTMSELKGASVSVNGSAATEVKGGAMVKVQGGIVMIN
jgi:uncharacterized protein involved in type VI secretion and phage assembly